jgi:hypothetical protein
MWSRRYTSLLYSHKIIFECGLGSGTNNYQEVKVFVDFDEISLRRRTEGSFLCCDSGGFLFTGGMTKFEVDIKFLSNKQM